MPDTKSILDAIGDFRDEVNERFDAIDGRTRKVEQKVFTMWFLWGALGAAGIAAIPAVIELWVK